MTAPNMFIVYVNDVQASATFYGDLFEIEPAFTSPRFITFALGGDVQLALWNGGRDVRSDSPRTSEVCLNLQGGAQVIDEIFSQWSGRGVVVIEPPHDDVFGRTFVVADPDGNLIRVAPVD
jgi:predicted enzyme related to lactoylglutathione lyase